MARRLSMTGEVVDAARAERIGLVTEVVAHERLLDRAVELAAQIAEVPGPTMRGLKEIYTTGAAAVIDPALAAEETIAFAQHRDFDGLGDQFRAVTERNKRQIDSSRPGRELGVVALEDELDRRPAAELRAWRRRPARPARGPAPRRVCRGRAPRDRPRAR